MDSSYERRGDSLENSSSGRRGGVEQDAALLDAPAVRPSKSLRAGDLWFLDDDDGDSSATDEDLLARSNAASAAEGLVHATRSSDDLGRSTSTHAEMREEGVTGLLAGQQGRQEYHPKGHDPAGKKKSASPQVLGKWNATMVFRERSVQGTVCVLAESLLFQSVADIDHQRRESLTSPPTPTQGQKTWRWQLIRLTQVIRHP